MSLLVGIVSSRMLTDISSMRTMSGLASEVLMLVGIVPGGESHALHVRISAYRWTDAGRSILTLERKQLTTESCLHVYRPWTRVSWHPLSIWADVGLRESHNGHLLQIL